MMELEQKQLLVELAKSLFDRGFSVGGAGNISVRLDTNRILITPTGSSLGRLQPEQLSIVDLNGNLLSGNKPSKEVVFHLAIYQANPSHQAIVHLHSTYLTALSCLADLDWDNAISPFTPYYVMRVGKLPVIPYYCPGSPQIAIALAEKTKHHKAVLLANHGVVVCGKNLQDAVDNTEELEETAKLNFLLQPYQIRHLTQNEVQELNLKGK